MVVLTSSKSGIPLVAVGDPDEYVKSAVVVWTFS